jgi:hypothetical protein
LSLLAPVLSAETVAQRSEHGEADIASADRPFVVLTDQRLANLRSNARSTSEPYATAWEKLEAEAAEALDQPLAPRDFQNSTELLYASRDAAGAARDLVLVSLVTGEDRLCMRAKNVLLSWATFEPSVGASLERIEHGTVERIDGSTTAGLGLNVGLAAFYWSELFCLLWPDLAEQERVRVEAWLRDLGRLIREGHRYWIDNDYYGEQDYNNHLTGHLLGLAALGYAIGDRELISYAYDCAENPRDYREMLQGAILMPSKGRSQFWRSDPGKTTSSGEMYDRYRVLTKRRGKGHGLAYAMMHLRMLVLLAEIADVHGVDYYSYVGPAGENLRLPLEFYAPFYVARSPAVKGTYHAGDRLYMHNLPVFTIAGTRYPDSRPIQEVLEANAEIILPSDELGYAVHLISPESGEEALSQQ